MKKGFGRGKILRVRYGYNPNSSSIGALVQVLMWGTAFAAAATIFLSATIRSFRRWKGPSNDTQV